METPDPPPENSDNHHPYTTLNSHCHELQILHDLASSGSYLTILDKVARARSLSLLTKPHEHLIYLTFNVLSLVKLRRFPDAHQELQTFLPDEEIYNNNQKYLYQSYPDIYPNHSPGSMIPFSLRVLHAHLPFTLGNRQLTLDRLYLLLQFVRDRICNLVHKLFNNNNNNNTDNDDDDDDSISSVSRGIWIKRESFVLNTIISHHLSLKEYKVCLSLLKTSINNHESRDGESEDPVMVSKLGYVQLQYGDLEGGKASFDLVEKIVNGKGNENGEDVGMRNLVSRNKALMYLVEKDYISAVREYDECMERDGSDVVAINNKAICLMYLRDLSDSIKVLESALERVPTMALNETLVVNLCSMYELAYVNHGDVKKTLSNWIARVAPDDFDTSCTRI